MIPSPTLPADTLGLAYLTRIASDPVKAPKVWEGLIQWLADHPDDPGALLDLSTLLQLTGNREKGLELQAQALSRQTTFRKSHGDGSGVRILAFMTAGDLMANTPIDFLLEGSNAQLISCYLTGGLPSPAQIPQHDVAFLAIGQSETSGPLLEALSGALADWPHPVLNNRPAVIAALTRNGVADRLAPCPGVAAPPTRRVAREALSVLPAGISFPIVIRPAGSQAGAGLERVADAAALKAYLQARDEAEFYVSPFVDYSGADGLFRKLRIVFVAGRAFLSHMAVSPRWMVHYLNADMEANPTNRAEEARMMATFDEDFAVRHARAFKALNEAFGLDYFGVDCAETPDGRLLIFEADVAMIVHAMDPPDLYPYKQPAMAKLFRAFLAALEGAARTPAPAG